MIFLILIQLFILVLCLFEFLQEEKNAMVLTCPVNVCAVYRRGEILQFDGHKKR